MNDQHSTLMITVLRREYPEIAISISDKINKNMPERSVTDLTLINQIVASFKKDKGITESQWIKGKSKIKITESRELLIAVTLLFYHPEKLLQLTSTNTRYGVLKILSELIGTSLEVLSKSVPNVIVAFKAYEDFKIEVYRLYDLIKNENQFFK
jgi:hypothetical protein